MGQHLHLGAICHVYQPSFLTSFCNGSVFSLELICKFWKIFLLLFIIASNVFYVSKYTLTPQIIISSRSCCLFICGYSENHNLFHASLSESIRSAPLFMFKSMLSISFSGCFTVYTKLNFFFSLLVTMWALSRSLHNACTQLDSSITSSWRPTDLQLAIKQDLHTLRWLTHWLWYVSP